MGRFGSIQATEATALVIFWQFLRWQVDKLDLEKSYEILSANIGYNPRERTHNLTLPTDGKMLLSNKTLSIECYSETLTVFLCSIVILYPL